MAVSNTELVKIIEPAVTTLGCELVGCERVGSDNSPILRVYVDAPGGITMAAIEQVSRQISALLDVADPFTGKYQLEVSSPGLDRPLFTLAHYQRFVGHQIKLRLHQPVQGRRNYAGTLENAVDDTITLRMSDAEAPVQFALADIEKANLVSEL